MPRTYRDASSGKDPAELATIKNTELRNTLVVQLAQKNGEGVVELQALTFGGLVRKASLGVSCRIDSAAL